MTIFGNLFRTPSGGGGGPIVDLDGEPIDRQIAFAMANAINGEPSFSGLTAEVVENPKRRLADMTEGDVLLDCLGIGSTSTVQNRRFWRKEYVTHAALRSKLTDADVTAAILKTLGKMSEAVQKYFEDSKTLTLDDQASATLLGAEPFVHVVRGTLYGEGVFLCPIQFTWLYKPA